MLTGSGLKLAKRLAVPSYIVPAGIVENCRFLSPYFQDIGLYFLELRASLAYAPHELPRAGDADP